MYVSFIEEVGEEEKVAGKVKGGGIKSWNGKWELKEKLSRSVWRRGSGRNALLNNYSIKDDPARGI